jgi:hypothetical protein
LLEKRSFQRADLWLYKRREIFSYPPLADGESTELQALFLSIFFLCLELNPWPGVLTKYSATEILPQTHILPFNKHLPSYFVCLETLLIEIVLV